jgi:hypothetical protein
MTTQSDTGQLLYAMQRVQRVQHLLHLLWLLQLELRKSMCMRTLSVTAGHLVAQVQASRD